MPPRRLAKTGSGWAPHDPSSSPNPLSANMREPIRKPAPTAIGPTTIAHSPNVEGFVSAGIILERTWLQVYEVARSRYKTSFSAPIKAPDSQKRIAMELAPI